MQWFFRDLAVEEYVLWRIGGIAIGSLVSATVGWGLAEGIRSQAFQDACDPQLPIAVRVNAIGKLAGRRALAGRWRDRISRLLSDLQTYDRSPVVREASAAALRRLFR